MSWRSDKQIFITSHELSYSTPVSLPLGSHDVMCATFNKGEKTETLHTV